jgi:hypothetical protein
VWKADCLLRTEIPCPDLSVRSNYDELNRRIRDLLGDAGDLRGHDWPVDFSRQSVIVKRGKVWPLHSVYPHAL